MASPQHTENISALKTQGFRLRVLEGPSHLASALLQPIAVIPLLRPSILSFFYIFYLPLYFCHLRIQFSYLHYHSFCVLLAPSPIISWSSLNSLNLVSLKSLSQFIKLVDAGRASHVIISIHCAWLSSACVPHCVCCPPDVLRMNLCSWLPWESLREHSESIKVLIFLTLSLHR